MLKIFTVAVLVVLVSGGRAGTTASDKVEENGSRQKRLLFYDEQGNLVKTFPTTFIQDINQNVDKNPFFWNFLNPFFTFLRPAHFGGSSIAYMIPVSEGVIQQINSNPLYHNKLLILSTRDPLIEANPLCAGKRAQIPSPNLCSNYLNCWDGWAFEQECPAGLLFSTEGYCDYPHQVDCKNRRLKDDTQPKCANDFESFRNEANCNEFFVCVHSLPVRFKCPADLAYSQWRCEVNENEANCNEFFVCVHSLPVRFKCPVDLAYSQAHFKLNYPLRMNKRLGVCDYPFRVECNASIPAVAGIPSNGPPAQASMDAVPSSTTAASASEVLPSSTATSATPIVPSTPGAKDSMIQNIEYNTQSWSSTHVAISRQDAIRQLKLGRLAQVKADQ